MTKPSKTDSVPSVVLDTLEMLRDHAEDMGLSILSECYDNTIEKYYDTEWVFLSGEGYFELDPDWEVWVWVHTDKDPNGGPAR